MRPLFSCLLAAAFLQTSPVAAQPAGQAPQQDVVIHAGTLLDRPGKPPRRNASLVVRGGKIVSVHDGFIEAPAGASHLRELDSKGGG